MEMVGHQAIDVSDDSEFLMGFSQTLEKKIAIVIGKEDRLPQVAPREDVVKSAWIFDP